jgi:hypothetical protein
VITLGVRHSRKKKERKKEKSDEVLCSEEVGGSCLLELVSPSIQASQNIANSYKILGGYK